MKIRQVLLTVALLPLIGSTITVECVDAGTQHPFTLGSFQWDYSYKVTLGVNEELDWFHVGVGPDAQITNFEVVDASTTELVSGWFGGVTSGPEDQGTLVDHLGEISLWAGTTADVAAWTTFGSSISDGVYYFGFDCPDPEGVFGFLAKNDSASLRVEDWNEPVGQGAGSIHAPIPEPASASLLLVALGAIGLIRKIRSHC